MKSCDKYSAALHNVRVNMTRYRANVTLPLFLRKDLTEKMNKKGATTLELVDELTGLYRRE